MPNIIAGKYKRTKIEVPSNLVRPTSALKREAIFSILAIRDQVVPPTINLNNPAVDTPIDLVPKVSKKRDVCLVMSNSFGFGGTNASILFKKFKN